MKEVKRALRLMLITIFFLGFFPLSLHSEDTMNLEILLSSNNSIYLSTLQNIQSSSKKKMNLNFTSSMNEIEMKSFFVSLEKKKIPFLITLGTQASLLAKENLKSTPILYSLVNAPRSLGFQFQSNTCGIHIDVPIQDFFKTLKDIKPDAKIVASIFSSPTGELLVNEADYSDSLYGIIFQKVKVEDKAEFSEKLLSLKGKIDAFYIVPDSIYTQENFELLSNFAKENKIILMTQIPFIVNVGTTFSITPYYARAGAFIGDMVNEILSGKSECKSGYAYAVKEFSLNLNKSYAEESGIILPESIIRRAENSRLLMEGIHFYEKGNFEISSLVMDKILKEDPTNYTAFYYKNYMNQKLNGDKISNLFEKARSASEAKDFRKEREIYSQILKLEPENSIAKNKNKESLLNESENERLEGERLEAKGDILSAIGKYNSALSILASNTKAKINLDTIRKKERKNIPTYFNTATKLFNERNYLDAELNFKKILAIEPGDKNALEYLKLSTEKKISMKKFEECIENNDPKCKLIWQKRK